MAFVVIFLLIGTALYFLSFRLMHWVRTWGATPEEQVLALPGTDPLKNRRITCTHAISIHAPTDIVWSYLVQIGQNKGGFYSYRWLENLVGCHMPNIKTIVPELQKIRLGDKVFLHPTAPPLTVTQLIPGQLLALEGWYLMAKPLGPNQTRLIARGYEWRDSSADPNAAKYLFSGPIFDIAHFIMERKMLLNIKRLAESCLN